jgi:hypothetical protein
MAWMIRNEDFFYLRWGVSAFIRSHIAQNTRDYVGGYFVGSECYIPAADQYTKLDHEQWRYAFERQWLFYKLWGRLLYDPATPDAVFKGEFVRRYGREAAVLLDAYAAASQMPLLYCSFFDINNDKSAYAEGFLLRDNEDSSIFADIDLILRKGSLDPDFIPIGRYVEALLAGEGFPRGAITPLQLADRLGTLAEQARKLIEPLDAGDNVAYRYELADIRAWCALSDYFAEKLRAGVALQTFRRTGETDQQRMAVNHLEQAQRHWERLCAITDPIYKPSPATHLHLHEDSTFIWSRFRPSVARDIEIARQSQPDADAKPRPAQAIRTPIAIKRIEVKSDATPQDATQP